MFGFGAARHRRVLSESFGPTVESLFYQLDEFRMIHGIPSSYWNKWESYSFTCWAYFFSILNSGLDRAIQRKLQYDLNLIANEYSIIPFSHDHSEVTEPLRKAMWKMMMDNIQVRALQYNEAFERDKSHVLNPDFDQRFTGVNISHLFIQNISIKPLSAEMVSRIEPHLRSLLMSHWVLVCQLFQDG